MKFLLPYGPMLTKTTKIRKNLKLKILKKREKMVWRYRDIHAAVSEKPEFTDGQMDGRLRHEALC